LSFNLALILVALTAFTGIVVGINRFIWQRDENGGPRFKGRMTLVEYSQSFFPVLLFVLVIRSFVFEPFRIPSGSMMPTLLQGDFIFVKKYSYGLRLPVTETKILETGSPERGDVVVFRLPRDPSLNYIKRVIGLPGDRIVYSRHRLYVNGEPVEVTPPIDPNQAYKPTVYQEQLFDRMHDIQVTNANSNKNWEGIVPEGHYFMMGDNRDNSRDSRFPREVGFVPESHLVGEAVRVWLHMDGLTWPDWERMGLKIQ
jgi:signal peptidase I